MNHVAFSNILKYVTVPVFFHKRIAVKIKPIFLIFFF